MRSKGLRRDSSPEYTERTFDQIAAAYELPDGTLFASVSSRDVDDDTVLHRAAYRGSLEDVWDLLRLGSDVNAKGDLGHTPLHYAAMAGNRSAVIAPAGASHKLHNEWKQTPSETADVGGHHEKWNGG